MPSFLVDCTGAALDKATSHALARAGIGVVSEDSGISEDARGQFTVRLGAEDAEAAEATVRAALSGLPPQPYRVRPERTIEAPEPG